jgi:putative sugar O-methyltransferase
MVDDETLMSWTGDRFNIPADPDILEWIISDASNNGGSLAPGTHWHLDPDKVGSLSDMLDPLIGCVGMQPVDADAVACFEPFLRAVDHLGLCEPDLLAQARRLRWLKGDLGTVMDLNLLTAYLPDEMPRPLRICEVGGGFGRVAEAFLELCKEGIHYVLVDAVPASMMYAYQYLRRAFPERKIGSVYAGDTYDTSFDCFILPAWQSDALQDASFHLAVNIESMQEMEDHHIKHFMTMFDRVTTADATIYISNARDYVYRGAWTFPPSWEVLFQHNTPRSWTKDHPTIIMVKRPHDQSEARAVREAEFQAEMLDWDPGLNMLQPAPARR